MTDDVSERLSEIRERVEAATEGPWEAGVDRLPEMGGGRVMVRNVERGRKISECGHETLQQATPNSTFIASARSDVPYLLSLVEEVDGKVREAIDHLEHAVGASHAGQCDFHATAALEALRDAAQEGEGE